MIAATAAIAAAVAAASASATPAARSKLGGTPTLTQPIPVPVVTDATDLALPIMGYLMSPEEELLLGQAHEVLVGRCFDRFGIAAPVLPDFAASPVTRTARRYGLTDASLAAASGYHLTTADAGDKPMIDMSAEQELVLVGTPDSGTTVGGERVPAEGCTGEAFAALGGDGGNAELAQRIDVRSVSLAAKDARVRDAFAAWSSCMRDRGHIYAMPWDPPNDPRFTGPSPAPDEAAVAVDDVECKDETNVVGTWFAVDAALQAQLIDRHSSEFAQIAADITARLDHAASVMDGASTR